MKRKQPPLHAAVNFHSSGSRSTLPGEKNTPAASVSAAAHQRSRRQGGKLGALSTKAGRRRSRRHRRSRRGTTALRIKRRRGARRTSLRIYKRIDKRTGAKSLIQQPDLLQPFDAEEAAAAQQDKPAAEQQTEQMAGEAELEERYQAGLREGYFEGGEGEVARLLPPNTILQGYTARDIIAAGLSQLPREAFIPLLPAEGVTEMFRESLTTGRSLSLVRLGDGELLTLAHDTVLPVEEARRRGPFLPYAGVELPDPGVREKLAQALFKADIIGVPQSRHPSFQGLLFPVLSHYGLDPAKLRLTLSTVNYAMVERGLLLPLLQGRKVLVVGNKSPGLAEVLARSGVEIGGIIPSVQGAHDAENAVAAAAGHSFDLALVSAGIAAVLICSEIASRLGKPAIDFGHLANKLESGEMTLR